MFFISADVPDHFITSKTLTRTPCLSLSYEIKNKMIIILRIIFPRYLVLHVLAKLLHIRLEGDTEGEEELRKSRKKKEKKLEDKEAQNSREVTVTEGWKRGWDVEEEEAAPNPLDLTIRLARFCKVLHFL